MSDKTIVDLDVGRFCDSMYHAGTCCHLVKAIYNDGTWESLGLLSVPMIRHLVSSHRLPEQHMICESFI